MNQLACIYFETLDTLVDTFRGDELSSIANKCRSAICFAHENSHFKLPSLNTKADPHLLRHMLRSGVLHVHELVVPHLIRKDPVSPNLSKASLDITLKELNGRPPIVSQTHRIWIYDIDLWYNFPESWVSALKPAIPHAFFAQLSQNV